MGHMYLFFREIFSEKKDKKSPGNRVECAPCALGNSSPPSGNPDPSYHPFITKRTENSPIEIRLKS
jgi:hypothetical protein